MPAERGLAQRADPAQPPVDLPQTGWHGALMKPAVRAALCAALLAGATTAAPARATSEPDAAATEAAPIAAEPAAKKERPVEVGPTFTFGASTSFVFDINQPDSQVTGENQKLYADGESEESFNIDLVQIGVSGSRGIAHYGAKIDFGDWTSEISDNLDGDVGLQEMYLAIDASYVTVTAGRMPTPLGYEVLEPWANPQISRSRAWYYHAVSHDGAALSGEIGGVSLMAAVVNGFDINDPGVNNPDDEYGVIGSASYFFGDTEARLSMIYSDEKDEIRFFEINGFVSGNWRNVRYGLEGTWLDGDGHGAPAVPRPLDVSVWDVTGYGGATFGQFSADVRLSYTDEEGTNRNFFNRNKDGIVSFTATGGYEIVDGVILRAEYRVDSASDPIFDDHNSQSTVAGPVGLRDMDQVVQVQLLWTPATGQD